MIGTDIPDISGEVLQKASELLMDYQVGAAKGASAPSACCIVHISPKCRLPLLSLAPENLQVVLGPAADGGFYLVGVSAQHPGLFKASGIHCLLL